MIVGINHVLSHAGKEYHVQVEDLGVDTAVIEVRVYDAGSVVWRKRIPYAELLQQGLPRQEMEVQLHALMEKTIHTVEAAIAKGKLQ